MECTNKENKMTEKAMESQFASDLESDDLDRNNNSKGGSKSKSKSKSNAKNGKNYEKYSLRPRSIQNRIETEKRQTEVKKKPKPKQKPPPLSKYRRKTANARERGRMREINEAFDCLQRAVPQYPILPVNAQGKTCEKLTKITTLRLAMNYIEALAQLLNNPPVVCGSESGNSTDIESYSSPSSSSVISGNFSSSSSDFSPASSFAMSPLSMSMSCSPAPDCLQTVMRSVVSPASAAATAAAAAATAAALNINPNTNTILRTHVNINNTTTTIPHHHHRISEQQRINNNNSTIVNLNQPNLSFNVHSQNQNLTTVVTTLPVNLIDNNNLLLSGSNLVSQSPPGMSSTLSPIPVVPSFSPPMPLLLSPSSICSSSPTSSSACSPKIFNSNNMNKITTKLPPISSSLSSALLKRSMSSFIADCAHMTGVINNNGHRTGSLSSLTESDLSEYASDLLSDEGSTLDDPMFDDLIGVNVATDLELLLESDGDSLHFSSDLSDT